MLGREKAGVSATLLMAYVYMKYALEIKIIIK